MRIRADWEAVGRAGRLALYRSPRRERCRECRAPIPPPEWFAAGPSSARGFGPICLACLNLEQRGGGVRPIGAGARGESARGAGEGR